MTCPTNPNDCIVNKIPLRFVERKVCPLGDVGHSYIDRILQYQTASGEWVDVPVVGDGG